MDLVFKLDYDNKLWLLMCTGMKIREKFKQFVEKEDGVETNFDLKSKTQRPPSPIFKFTENPDIEDENLIISSLQTNKGFMV